MHAISSRLLILFSVHGFVASVVWPCDNDAECVGLENGICVKNQCSCPSGKLMNHDNTRCINASSYYGSECEESAQCSRLVTGYSCDNNACVCREGYRYLSGRCWAAVPYGEPCLLSEQCRDPWLPLSLQCKEGACLCADGHYLRQKSECRKISEGIGSSCILDADCQLPGVSCDLMTMTCRNGTALMTRTDDPSRLDREEDAERRNSYILESGPCEQDRDCATLGFASCSSERHCVCNLGYYPNTNGTLCLAELGMPANSTNCKGRFALLENGLCVCPNGFFSQPGNRDCKKPTRRFEESCLDDGSCYTFGSSSFCSEPDNNGVTKCLCDLENSVQDFENQICKIFVKVIGDDCENGEECPSVSECIKNICTCPEGFITAPGGKMCLPANLEIGETCTLDEQCGVENSNCKDKSCQCEDKYISIDSKCLPGLGSACEINADCIVTNSICSNMTTTTTRALCSCEEDYVNTSTGLCLASVNNVGDACQLDEQCWHKLGGEGSVTCKQNKCQCETEYHYRENKCYKQTGLREQCSKTPQCYLDNGESWRTECRNGVCECQRNFRASYSPDACSSGIIHNNSIFYYVGLVAFIFMFE